jgi:hypothetical protein
VKLLFLLSSVINMLFVTPSHAESGPTVPPDYSVEGLTQAEWSQAWWQWAGSFDHNESPIADQTGELCGNRQTGLVWFLAGTYGTNRTVRTCNIPKDRYLFFPLINYVTMRPANRVVSCMGVMSHVAAMTDEATALILDVDGVRVKNLNSYRQATECFDMGKLAKPKVRIFPSAANGYYVMLKPLSSGTHTINFGGALPGILQAVTYTLIVK